MSEFFKKALGLFVEFDDKEDDRPASIPVQPATQPVAIKQQSYKGPLSQQDVDKFSKHFSDLFDRANLPGPDYYEFSKMMHLLESQIPDENVRIATVFASLSIQGITKEKLMDTAKQYCAIIENDKTEFEKAAAEKASTTVDGRRAKVDGLEKKIADNTEMIRKLNQEITDAQAQIATLKNEIVQEDSRIASSKGSFMSAYQAMYNKINSDIQKINTIIK